MIRRDNPHRALIFYRDLLDQQTESQVPTSLMFFVDLCQMYFCMFLLWVGGVLNQRSYKTGGPKVKDLK